MCWHSDAAGETTSGFCPAMGPELGPTRDQQGTDAPCTLSSHNLQSHLKWLRAETSFVCHVSTDSATVPQIDAEMCTKKVKKSLLWVAFRGTEQRKRNTWQKDRKNPMICCLENPLKQSKLLPGAVWHLGTPPVPLPASFLCHQPPAGMGTGHPEVHRQQDAGYCSFSSTALVGLGQY